VIFVLTFCNVLLLVRAVTGGASAHYGKNNKTFQRAFSPNKLTKSQTINFKYLWVAGSLPNAA
jgi:preprotein translocase subunit SecG